MPPSDAPPSGVPYRPLHRAPMALLTVLHDGRADGQVLPLRADRFVIGRAEGDLVIPHDAMMSARHAEISRAQVQPGQWRWALTDLRSTNGTYVRAGHVLLPHDQEVLLGCKRYRFEEQPEPALVELMIDGNGPRYPLANHTQFVGRSPAESEVVLADPMVSPRHARVFRDARGRWVLENAGSLNGVWARVQRVTVEDTAQFQLGEQRFLLETL